MTITIDTLRVEHNRLRAWIVANADSQQVSVEKLREALALQRITIKMVEATP